MSLASGTRLGHYEIVASIGAGGMGEVYRARDSRLGRDVAVKVLPSAFLADPERLHRFEQEARAAAALNHPNILAVHDIGQHDCSPFIVSELLQGETLRTRLQTAAVPVRKAIDLAIQIAHGLAAAHEKGIVHRDLKPENLFVTTDGRVKILDFGLAKLTQAEPAPGTSSIATVAVDTEAGRVLGTVGYMAPEQVRGLPADHRADLFAFGTVLYELVAGRRAFQGATAADTMMAILKEDPPDLPTAERHVPPALARIVGRCLEKNPAARFQSAGDLAFALEALSSSSETASVTRSVSVMSGRERLAWIAVGGLALTLAFGAVWLMQRLPVDVRSYRTAILPPPETQIADFGNTPSPARRLAISPDGRRLAFTALDRDNRIRLWIRPLDALAAQPVEGSDGATFPFWSPDSRFVAFFADGERPIKLKKIDLAGGPPVTICEVPGVGAGGTWNREDVILFGSNPGPVQRVAASGGTPVAVTTLDQQRGENGHWTPFFLPDGRHFLYLAIGTQSARLEPQGIYVASLGADEPKLLAPGGSNAKHVNGYLLFLRDAMLMAQPFDAERVELTGEAVPIAEQIAFSSISKTGAFSLSEAGHLVYQTRSAGGGRFQLRWFDRTGKAIGQLGDELEHGDVELSPDGRRVAVSVREPARGDLDIWLYDVARNVRTRFTFDTSDEATLQWSPDGSRVAFNARVRGRFSLFQKASSGAGAPEELLAVEDASSLFPVSWSPDGQSILYVKASMARGNDLWVLPLTGARTAADRKPSPFVQTTFSETSGQFSPDGRWIAYSSNESGRREVYVAPFPGPGGKWQISTAGGDFPRWRRDGKEVFYSSLDGDLMVAEVSSQASAFDVGAVRPLFQTRLRTDRGYGYAVSADGQRFLVNTITELEASAPITLVVNWMAGLKR